ncbi:hypothetical protein [Methylobacterium nodulans]|uniref:Uncharacterized protein n=1 Tax=Methylobacterium nodulans (strain LMG 21967 / CNCM I-2342 / ORS 2060) TaxID=460265 RepID=B8INZ1_METNO|nr:hypothetical protein [Methylobacterium nodulans]ACL58507.1 hypothetical protein Mnod_3598 [Methylobacterium nodulans ORS 2060]
MPDRLSLLDLICIAAATVELLIATVWRMPAAVMADWLDLAAGRGGATVGV